MRSRRRRTVSAAALALVLVAAAAVALAMRAGLIGDRAAASAATSTATAPTLFSTPTPSAPAALSVEPGPNQPVATDPTRSTTSTAPTAASGGGPARVPVVVTYADANPDGSGVEVDGFVPGVVEGGGRCTLRLTNGQRSAEVSGDAQPNASTTSCGALVVPADQLSAGTWGAVLSYASATSAGSSSVVDVVVP